MKLNVIGNIIVFGLLNAWYSLFQSFPKIQSVIIQIKRSPDALNNVQRMKRRYSSLNNDSQFPAY
jgi:hypothetical protein